MLKKIFQVLSFLCGTIAVLAVFGLAGSSDMASRYNQDFNPGAYWTIPIAIVSALAAWFFHELAKTYVTRKVAAPDAIAIYDNEVLDWAEDRRTGYGPMRR